MTLVYQDEPWMEKAACRGAVYDHGNYDEFWQRKDASSASVTRTKFEMCATCPVAFECFEYADRIEAIGGIWGGMDPDPRRRMVNRFGSAQKAKAAHAAHIKELRRTRDRRLAKMEKRLA